MKTSQETCLETANKKVYRAESFIDMEAPPAPIQSGPSAEITPCSSSVPSRGITSHSRSHRSLPGPAVSVSTQPAQSTLPSGEPSGHLIFPVSPMTPPTRSPVASPVDQHAPTRNSETYPGTMEHVAEAAMVMDGYRHHHHHHHHHPSVSEFASLPPYTPGPSRQFMDGHGNENNEMRLSEYVKGQTRAQHLKDAGGGF